MGSPDGTRFSYVNTERGLNNSQQERHELNIQHYARPSSHIMREDGELSDWVIERMKQASSRGHYADNLTY
jgi:hypothetical protein